MNSTAKNSFVHRPWYPCAHISLGIEKEWSRHKLCRSPIMANSFQSGCTSLQYHQQYLSFCSFTFLSTVDTVRLVLVVVHLEGVKWLFIMIFTFSILIPQHYLINTYTLSHALLILLSVTFQCRPLNNENVQWYVLS